MQRSLLFRCRCSIEDILAESDSDLSEDEGKAQKKTGKGQKGKAWLKEGVEDDPLNFLDPKVSQRVLGKTLAFTCRRTRSQVPYYHMRFLSATNPAQKKRSKVEHGFKVTSDGRLIIRDEDEDDAGDKGTTWLGWPVSFARACCGRK